MKTIQQLNLAKSAGHVAFMRLNYNNGEVTELYVYGDSCHLAPCRNAFDIEHGVRHGQREHWASQLDATVERLKGQSYEFVQPESEG